MYSTILQVDVGAKDSVATAAKTPNLDPLVLPASDNHCNTFFEFHQHDSHRLFPLPHFPESVFWMKGVLCLVRRSFFAVSVSWAVSGEDQHNIPRN
jgi:hypothetical protein